MESVIPRTSSLPFLSSVKEGMALLVSAAEKAIVSEGSCLYSQQ
jgi:hypothetical protein